MDEATQTPEQKRLIAKIKREWKMNDELELALSHTLYSFKSEAYPRHTMSNPQKLMVVCRWAFKLSSSIFHKSW